MARYPLIVVLVSVLIVTSGSAGAASGSISEPSAPRDQLGTETLTSNSVTTIANCTDITSPGYYRLGEDITNTTVAFCITISASDVVLDGAGHRLDGINESPSRAIEVTGTDDNKLTNVTVKDIVATDWDQGLWVALTKDSRFVNNTMNSNLGYGIYVGYDATNNTFLENRLVNNRNANETLGPAKGIAIANHAPDNKVVDNYVMRNQGPGIALPQSNGTIVRDNVVVENSPGILIGQADDAVIANNVVKRNNDDGIKLGDEPHNVTIVDNRVTDNSYNGIFSKEGNTGAEIRRNNVTDNVGNGLLIQASDTEIRRNDVRRNGEHGIRLARNNGTVLVNNAITGNLIGVKLIETGDTVLRENTFDSNTQWDIDNEELSTSFTVQSTMVGTGTRISFKARNIAVRAAKRGPEALPEGSQPQSEFLKIKPRGDTAWIEITVHYDESVVANGTSVDLWSYSETWNKISSSAVVRGPDSIAMNLTDIEGVMYVVIAGTVKTTPAPTPTVIPSPSPTPTQTHSPMLSPTASPTAGPGQAGFGMIITLVGLLGAMLLAQRYRG